MPARRAIHTPHFGIDQYVRPIDSSSHFWLNQLLIGAIMSAAITVPHIRRKPEFLGRGIRNEHCIGIGDVNEQRRNEQRTNRTEEL